MKELYWLFWSQSLVIRRQDWGQHEDVKIRIFRSSKRWPSLKIDFTEATSTLIRFCLKTETSYRKRTESFSSTLQQENGVFQCIHSRERFQKAPFSPSTLQQENGVFESIHSGERFRKAPFSSVFGDRRRRISADEKSNYIK